MKRSDTMDTAPLALPVDLTGLRAMSPALDADMNPLVRARQSVRISHAAVGVAYIQG